MVKINKQLEKLKEIFNERGFISPNGFRDYINTESKINFICGNGHTHTSKAKNFIYGSCGCKQCEIDKRKKIIDTKLTENKLKKCNCCGVIKNLSEYGKDSNSEDKLKNTCKLCRRKQSNNLKLIGGVELKTKQQLSSAKYIETNPFKFLLSRCKQNHKKKGFIEEFNITHEYLELLYHNQNKLCYWSKIPMRFDNVGLGELDSISVDRLNSNIGYVVGNIVLTIKFINLGRGDVSKEYFTEFINKIKTNWLIT